MTPPRLTAAFYRLLVGGTVAQLGLDLTHFALAVTLIERSGLSTPFGLLLFFTAIGDLSTYPFAGVLADRSRRPMLLLGKGLQLPLVAAIALIAPSGASVWALYALIAGRTILEQIYRTSLTSAWAAVVPAPLLVRADALDKLLTGTTRISAPLIGNLLLEHIGARDLILCDVVTCAIAFQVLSTAQIPAPSAAVRPEVRAVVQEMSRAWRYIADRPGLLALLGLFAATSFMFGMVETLFPPLILKFSAPGALAVMMTASGVGLLIGAATMAIWGGPQRRAPFALAFGALRGLVLCLAVLPPRTETAIAAAFLFMLITPLADSCTGALWLSKVPGAMRGRVYAVQHLIGWPLYPIACAIAGPLADQVFEPAFGTLQPGHGIGILLGAVGALTAGVCLLGWFYPRLRRLHLELPDVEIHVDEQPRGK